MHLRCHSRAPLHFTNIELPVEVIEADENGVNVPTKIYQFVRGINQAAHRLKSAARRLADLRPPSPKLSTVLRSSMDAVRRIGRRSRTRRERGLQYTSLIEDDHLEYDE